MTPVPYCGLFVFSSVHSPHTLCTGHVAATNQQPEQTGEDTKEFKKGNSTTTIMFKLKKTVFIYIRTVYLYIHTDLLLLGMSR